ncbi:hypothetical protein KUCAC02_034927 [Chaenocephalus aceratus]|nr:hypothetical protein KUCAC02_034927 [Chaenocephalus aceratus]
MLGVHVMEFKCCLKGIRFRAALSTECSQAPDPVREEGHHEPPPLRRGPRGGGTMSPLLSDGVREGGTTSPSSRTPSERRHHEPPPLRRGPRGGGTMSPLLSDGVREEGAP